MSPRLLLILFTLLLASCAAPVPGLYPPAGGSSAIPVYVVYSGGIHSGISVPREFLSTAWNPVLKQAGVQDQRWIEFGWGEDDGYRKPLTLPIVVRSLMGSRETVMKVEGAGQSPGDTAHDPHATVIEVRLTPAGFARLEQFISGTFARDANGRPLHLEGSWFKATGKYSGFHTCNNWTADALRAAGCPVRPGPCQFPGPLVFQAKRFGKVLQQPRAQ